MNCSGVPRKGARNRSQLRALPRSHAHLPAPQPSGYYALASTGAVAYTSDDAVTCARRDGSSLVRRSRARTAAAHPWSRLTRPARAGLLTTRGIFDTRGEGGSQSLTPPASLPALGLVVVSADTLLGSQRGPATRVPGRTVQNLAVAARSRWSALMPSAQASRSIWAKASGSGLASTARAASSTSYSTRTNSAAQ